MTHNASEKYAAALNADIHKLTEVIRRLDRIIDSAGKILENAQPRERGRLAIVWENQDIRYGKALTPRLVEFTKIRAGGWRYNKLSTKYLTLRVKNKGEFSHDMDIVKKTLEHLVGAFEMRRRVMEKIRIFRLTATLMHQNNRETLENIHLSIQNLSDQQGRRNLH